MKKLTTQINEDNKPKTIFVWVDDTTASLLYDCDERIRHEYIVAEYKDNLINRAETRRHVSLDQIMDNGMNFVDYSTPDLEDILDANDLSRTFEDALSILTLNQKWLIEQIYYFGRSKGEIAEELGIDKSAISHRLRKIYKKLKEIL